MLKRRHLRNQKGLATLEMIPVMIVIAILINFALGFFGVIQTGILNSIAARNYAFETFRHRTNLMYFHDVRGEGTPHHYRRYNTRVHGIASEKRSDNRSVATTRPIGFGMNPEGQGSAQDHNPMSESDNGIFSIKERVRNEDISIAPVWVRPMYGICLNAKCEQ